MHLIPGVDDGAENMEMALAMVQRAREQGIIRIIATPHNGYFHYQRRGRAETLFRKLEDAVVSVYPDIKLYLGCEIICREETMDAVLEGLALGNYPTMNDTNLVLTEFSKWVKAEEMLPCVEALVDAAYIPIIAHMERYEYLWNNMELVDQIRELGALIQINVYSLFDEDDSSIKDWARHLVQERKVDFLGTDAHRTYHRPPSAQMGLNWLYENVERDYADAIAWKNAQKLLCN